MASLQTLPLRIATRGSSLALFQAEEVRRLLIAAHGLSPDDVEIVPITTTGDRVRDRPLAAIGGKGLFTKELEEALLAGTAHLAVHSLKDMPSVLPDGLAITCVLQRADPRDAFLSPKARTISALPRNATVGTSSIRRQAQLLRLRPDITVVPFRGNVQTRLARLAKGAVDATFLACAGLARLGLESEITARLSPEEMLPAIAQGTICVEIRVDDHHTAILVEALQHRPTALQVAAERAFLATLDGSCRTPIAGLAEIDDTTLRFRGMVLAPDGARVVEVERSGPAEAGDEIGRSAGEEALSRGAADLLSKMA